MKVRVKFSKQGKIKYIGHLDMMRYFQKAISRAKLPVAYSQGFNPHQIMTFSNPLGLGMTSDAEYMDIELEEEVPSKEGVDRLNAVMVDDIMVLSFKYLPEGTKNAMSSTDKASYEIKFNDKLTVEIIDCFKKLPSTVYFCDNKVHFEALIDNFMLQKECIFIKKTKKSTAEIDILPLIYKFSYNNDNNAFYITCSANSANNIKPEVIIGKLLEFAGIDVELNRSNLLINRRELYTSDGTSLDDIGKNLQ